MTYRCEKCQLTWTAPVKKCPECGADCGATGESENLEQPHTGRIVPTITTYSVPTPTDPRCRCNATTEAQCRKDCLMEGFA